MQRVARATFLALAVVLVAAMVQAGVTQYTDRPTFEAQGVIYENYAFEEYDFYGLTTPGEPFTAHGVTYTTEGGTLIIAGGGWLGMPDSYILNDWWTPLVGAIDVGPTYNMFAWDMTSLWSDYPVAITLTTNLGTYPYTVTAPAVPGSTFTGYIADPGEYFTGFRLEGSSGVCAPSMTHVTLGISGIVATEETSWSDLKALY
jgi:hypothetical protein